MAVNFVNRPNEISREYYDCLREGVIMHFSIHPDIISVYEYGSVKAPGISDLDLIIVCKDRITDFKPIPKLDYDIHNIMGSVTLMLMPVGVFKRLQHIDPFNLKLLTGIPIEPEYPEDVGIRDLVSVIDWLPERLIRMVKLRKAETIDINYALGLLYSFRYTIKKVCEILSIPVKPECEEIKQLRIGWFTSREPERAIPDLLARTATIAHDLVKAFDKHLDIHLELPTIRLSLSNGMDYIFDKPDDISSLEGSTERKGILHLPRSFYPHYAGYAGLPGYLPNELTKRIHPFIKIDNPLPKRYLDYQKKKMAICEENAQFVIENRLPKTLIRFGFWL